MSQDLADRCDKHLARLATAKQLAAWLVYMRERYQYLTELLQVDVKAGRATPVDLDQHAVMAEAIDEIQAQYDQFQVELARDGEQILRLREIERGQRGGSEN